jgi:branched-subunit amino acid transport protein
VTSAWIVIAGLTVSTIAIKATGPLLLGGRDLPGWALGVMALLAPALLAALTAVEALGAEDGTLSVDARTAGVAAAGASALARAPMVVTIGVAAGVAAAVRALG